MVWTVVPVAVLVSVLVGWLIGRARGLPVLGAILGFLGPLGWIGVLLLPRPQTATTPAPLAPHGSTTHGRPADLPPGQLPTHPPGLPADQLPPRPEG